MQKSFSGRGLRGTLFFAGLRGAEAAARLPEGRKKETVILKPRAEESKASPAPANGANARGRNRENRLRALRPIIENPTCCRASLRPGWLRLEEEQDCNAPRCFGGGITPVACPPPAAAEKIPLKRRVDRQVCGPPPRQTTESRSQRGKTPSVESPPGDGGSPPVIRLSFFGAFFRKKRRKNSPPHVSDYGRGPNAESGC